MITDSEAQKMLQSGLLSPNEARKFTDSDRGTVTFYADDKPWLTAKQDGYYGHSTEEALRQLSDIMRASSFSLGPPHKQTNAEWLRSEQERHWDIF